MIQSENENMNRNNENKKTNSFIVICEPLIRLAVSSYTIEFMGKKKNTSPSLRPSSPGPLCEIEFKCPAGEHCQGSHCHGNLGNVYQCLGDIQRAREYHKQHLEYCQGNRWQGRTRMCRCQSRQCLWLARKFSTSNKWPQEMPELCQRCQGQDFGRDCLW